LLNKHIHKILMKYKYLLIISNSWKLLCVIMPQLPVCMCDEGVWGKIQWKLW
jgi:hypothetical protein